mmetsp:Transcript_39187/g.70287  ORF Transcript_39187/g.70287 Transcript_39187/m.70287 type:complete len:333 (+) Transcript_39187:51-1049(+)
MKRRHDAHVGLPLGWEKKYATVYIDHNTETTHWTDPRQSLHGLFGDYSVWYLLQQFHGLIAWILLMALFLILGGPRNWRWPKQSVFEVWTNELPHSRPFDRLSGLDEVQFYGDFVVPSRAVMLQDGTKGWGALSSWTDHYLLEMVGDYSAKTKGTQGRAVAFRSCLKGDAASYFMGCILQPLPEVLQLDVVVPIAARFLGKPSITLWTGTNDEVAHYVQHETLLSIVSGLLHVCLVHPSRSTRVYYGQGVADGRADWSPVDFHAPDEAQFPLFKASGVQCTALEMGEMLFIPSYTWQHIKASPGRHLGVVMAFPAHHRLLDQLYTAMGSGVS